MSMANRTLTPNIQFQYAWCLVRTDNKYNLQTGANLLEGRDLNKSTDFNLPTIWCKDEKPVD